MGLLVAAGCHALIVVTSVDALRQFRDELLDKTTLQEDDIGEYYSSKKRIRAITITTYQTLTRLQKKVCGTLSISERISRCFGVPGEDSMLVDEFQRRLTSLDLFSNPGWGLVIFDEAHVLPAPTFRMAAHMQSIAHSGFTATPVREDGRDLDIFTLIGPTRYEKRWKDAEDEGWIAKAECYLIETPMKENLLEEYNETADLRERYRLSAENPLKVRTVEALVKKELQLGRSVMVIGEYIDFLREIASRLNAPFVYGSTDKRQRAAIFKGLRTGAIKCVVTSRVGGIALDFPDLDTVIRVTALFGSRQQETQGWGRAMRPKDRPAHLYAIVTPNSRDSHFASKRQRFFEEQGYRYEVKGGNT